MNKQFHSVILDKDKCRGCTNCIKRCPTEAIRVRKGKAIIIEERCIDCGECIRACPNQAKIALTDSLEVLKEYKYNVALPPPSFFAQFKPDFSPAYVLGALKAIGFHDVFEVPLAAEIVTQVLQRLVKQSSIKPIISSACPAVVRLIQVRFPSLLEYVAPVDAPMEVAARLARQQAQAVSGLPAEEIGVFFITPCPAKVAAIKKPFGRLRSNVTGALNISRVYGEVLRSLEKNSISPLPLRAGWVGIGWGRAGGESNGIGSGSLLAVDGLANVTGVLEQLERGELTDIDFLELQACPGGCIGGPLVPQSPFVARVRIRQLVEQLRQIEQREYVKSKTYSIQEEDITYDQPLQPIFAYRLSDDPLVAIARLQEVEKLLPEMPGLDCGSCGSPSCRALVEDIVMGYAQRTYCVFELRKRLQSLAEEMVVLAQKQPPAMGEGR